MLLELMAKFPSAQRLKRPILTRVPGGQGTRVCKESPSVTGSRRQGRPHSPRASLPNVPAFTLVVGGAALTLAAGLLLSMHWGPDLHRAAPLRFYLRGCGTTCGRAGSLGVVVPRRARALLLGLESGDCAIVALSWVWPEPVFEKARGLLHLFDTHHTYYSEFWSSTVQVLRKRALVALDLRCCITNTTQT